MKLKFWRQDWYYSIEARDNEGCFHYKWGVFEGSRNGTKALIGIEKYLRAHITALYGDRGEIIFIAFNKI